MSLVDMRCCVRSTFAQMFSVAALAATMAAPLEAQLTTVYDNSTVDTFISYSYAESNASRIGDVVQLGGTARLLSDVSVQFYNFSRTAGSFDTLLELFIYDGTVGSSIGSALVSGNAIQGEDILTVTFAGLNLTVPDQFAFLVGISGMTPGIDVGVNIFGPPAIGSSDATSFLADRGNGIERVTVEDGEGNLYLVARAVSVPEPSAALLMMGGLAALTFAAKRRQMV